MSKKECLTFPSSPGLNNNKLSVDLRLVFSERSDSSSAIASLGSSIVVCLTGEGRAGWGTDEGTIACGSCLEYHFIIRGLELKV